MNLVPWKPFGEVRTLRKEMDDLWNRFMGESPFVRFMSEGWMPSCDVSETKDKINIKMELPGLEAGDVELSLSGDLLTVRGEKKKEQEEKDEHHYQLECYSGSFQRTFRLPVEVDESKVDAKFDKGVLRITLPKTAKAKKKEIKIKAK